MHAENLSKDAYRLDWERIEQTIEEHFEGQDREILYRHFGLKGHSKTPLKTMCKALKLKPKFLKERLTLLERNLYKQLKNHDLDELILKEIQEMSLLNEVLNEES